MSVDKTRTRTGKLGRGMEDADSEWRAAVRVNAK